jgi:hypothetical protein
MERKITYAVLLCSMISMLAISCQSEWNAQEAVASLLERQASSMTPEASITGDQAAEQSPSTAKSSTGVPVFPTKEPKLVGTPKASPLTSPGQSDAPDEQPDAVQMAQDYLARHLSLSPGQIKLDSWQEAIWITPDLGCRPALLLDVQEAIEGYRILLNAKGQDYELHSDLSGGNICLAQPLQTGERISLAGQLRPANGVPATRDVPPEQIAELARQHLAARLGFPLDIVNVLGFEPAEWDDLSLGCAGSAGKQPDRALARLIPGYKILLSAMDMEHEYHSGDLWMVYCGSN